MKCFYHHDRDAVAVCYWCNRGLCPTCACEVEDRLACRGRCEPAVERAVRAWRASDQNVEKSEQANRVMRLANVGVTAVVLILGILVSAFGYSRWADAPILLQSGGVLILMGVVMGVATWRSPV